MQNALVTQVNEQEVIKIANALTTTSTLTMTIVATLNSQTASTTLSLQSTGYVGDLNSLYLSIDITTGRIATITTTGQNITVIDCTVNNNIISTVTSTINIREDVAAYTVYSVNGTLDARPYIFRPMDIKLNTNQGHAANRRSDEWVPAAINFKSNFFRTVYRRCRYSGGRDESRCPYQQRITLFINHGTGVHGVNNLDPSLFKTELFILLERQGI